MRCLFILLILMFGQFSVAQTNSLRQKLQDAILERKINLRKPIPNTFFYKNDSSIKIQPGIALRNFMPRIYHLKQDNMPCLVPDTKDIAAIPNAFGVTVLPFPTTIPNPAQKNTTK